MSGPDQFRSRARFVIHYAIAALLLFVFLWIARVVLLLLFAALLGALLMDTAAGWLHARLSIPRAIALPLLLAAAAAILVLGIYLRGPAIVDQFQNLQRDLPQAAHKLLAQLRNTGWGNWLLRYFSGGAQQLGGFAFTLSRIGGVVLSSATAITGLVIVVMASLYFAVEPGAYRNGLLRLVPAGHRALVERCLSQAARQLRWWLLANFVSMGSAGLLVAGGLRLLSIPLWGTLGVIAACLTVVPNAGAILSAIPAALLAFAVSPAKGMLTLLLFALVHFIEGNFITPLAERQIVKLPPGLTLAVQLFLAVITGALGIALAAPLTAAASAVVSTLLDERRTALEEFSPAPSPL